MNKSTFLDGPHLFIPAIIISFTPLLYMYTYTYMRTMPSLTDSREAIG